MTTVPRSTARGLVAIAFLAVGLAACGDDDTTTGAGTTSSAPAGEPVVDPGDGGSYDVTIDPTSFVPTIDNPYLPFAPGARWVYEGESDGELERTEVVVTDQRREVMGVSTTVVRDSVYLDGELIEDTYDWFAQDQEGNVWYFGEDSKEYEDGEVTSTEGSWEAGVDSALPGIVMPAHPAVGDAYRQEYAAGEAEDMAEVLEVGVPHTIGLGDYADVVVTEDWNPLEPETVEHKYYARGVGLIHEKHVRGDPGEAELVEH